MEEKRVEYKAKIKDMSEDERPRERLIKYGREGKYKGK